MSKVPVFPLNIFFKEEGEQWTVSSKEELAWNLEYFNSRDAEEKAIVTDSLGRTVRVLVDKLELKEFFLE